MGRARLDRPHTAGPAALQAARRTFVKFNVPVDPRIRSDERSRDLECGDSSPLWPLGRLVGQAEPRLGVGDRRNLTRFLVRRRQAAYGKRRARAAVHIAVVATFAALGSSVFIFGFHGKILVSD